MATVFVFGSNKLGIHGAGAAKYAKDNYQATQGVGVGRTGNAYAIPTKNKPTSERRQLALVEIAGYVSDFKRYATMHPEDVFEVTPIGCGLAGYQASEIGPMFAGCPPNVVFLDDQFMLLATEPEAHQ